jgi:hypothetical protein
MRSALGLPLLIVVSLSLAQSAFSQNQSAPQRANQPKSPAGRARGGPVATTAPQKVGKTKLDQTLPMPNNSLWCRYYSAGEDASIKNDEALAKKYYMASLAELEKHPQTKGSDIFMSVRLSALESALMEGYPHDWSKEEEKNPAHVMDERKEQVNVYQRIARINEYYAPPEDLLRIKAKERYETVRKDYEKALAASKSGSSKTDSSESESKEAASK